MPATPAPSPGDSARPRSPRSATGGPLAADLADIHARWSSALTARKTAAVWQVLPLLLSQPAVTSAVVQQATGLSQPTTDNVLRQLRDAGIIAKASGVQRYIVWVANDVTQALDAFAERARRG